MLFIVGTQALENFYCLFNGRLIDHDGLEAPFESGIAFDAFAVFIERGGTNHL